VSRRANALRLSMYPSRYCLEFVTGLANTEVLQICFEDGVMFTLDCPRPRVLPSSLKIQRTSKFTSASDFFWL